MLKVSNFNQKITIKSKTGEKNIFYLKKAFRIKSGQI